MSSIWQKLEQNHASNSDRQISTLFDDASRFEVFSAQTDDLLLDFSKTKIDPDALALLIELAETTEVAAQRDAMFAGQKIKTTEDRAVFRRSDPGLLGARAYAKHA